MKTIELVTIKENAVLIFVDKITFVKEYKENTIINFTGQSKIVVKNTIKEVISIIKQA